MACDRLSIFQLSKKISDVLWNEARLLIRPRENQIIPSDFQQQYHLGRYSMVLYMFLECLESISVEDRCCQRSMVQVRHIIDYSCNGQYKIFERLWTRHAKKSV